MLQCRQGFPSQLVSLAKTFNRPTTQEKLSNKNHAIFKNNASFFSLLSEK